MASAVEEVPNQPESQTVAEASSDSPRRSFASSRSSYESDVPSDLSDSHQHPEASNRLSRVKTEQKDDERDQKELINFLRNTTPPPQNFMSIPDSVWAGITPGLSRTKRNPVERKFKWPQLKPFSRRSKSSATSRDESRGPALLQLPDSAVAGTTIDGHRYIAISIPSELEYGEAGEYAESVSTQPVYEQPRASQSVELEQQQQQQQQRPSSQHDRPSTPRTFNPERGVVTVLRPVVEAHEPSDTTEGQNEAGQSSSSRAGGGENRLRRMSSASSSASASHYVLASSQRSSGAALPSRSQENLDNARMLKPPQDSEISNAGTGTGRTSIAESIVTTGSEPVVGDATTAQKYAPVYAGETEGSSGQQEQEQQQAASAVNKETIVFAPVRDLSRERSSAAGDDDDDGGKERSGPAGGPTETQSSQNELEAVKQRTRSKTHPVYLKPSPAHRAEIIQNDPPGLAYGISVEKPDEEPINDTLKITPIYTVIDVTPSSPKGSPALSSRPQSALTPPAATEALEAASPLDSLIDSRLISQREPSPAHIMTDFAPGPAAANLKQKKDNLEVTDETQGGRQTQDPRGQPSRAQGNIARQGSSSTKDKERRVLQRLLSIGRLKQKPVRSWVAAARAEAGKNKSPQRDDSAPSGPSAPSAPNAPGSPSAPIVPSAPGAASVPSVPSGSGIEPSTHELSGRIAVLENNYAVLHNDYAQWMGTIIPLLENIDRSLRQGRRDAGGSSGQ